MQCASSIATSDTPLATSASRASVPPSVSGVVITSSGPLAAISAIAARRAGPRTVPSRRTQRMPFATRRRCWSWSSAISGDTTTTGFGSSIDGTW